jgi:hypothetical protein
MGKVTLCTHLSSWVFSQMTQKCWWQGAKQGISARKKVSKWEKRKINSVSKWKFYCSCFIHTCTTAGTSSFSSLFQQSDCSLICTCCSTCLSFLPSFFPCKLTFPFLDLSQLSSLSPAHLPNVPHSNSVVMASPVLRSYFCQVHTSFFMKASVYFTQQNGTSSM